MASVIQQIQSRWYHFFPDFQLSTDDFYTLAEQQVRQKEIPNVRMKRITFLSTNWMVKREYLRIQGGDCVFDLCAAPYGNGYFISWWMGESKSLLYRALVKIPILGLIPQYFSTNKTYFQWDTETMFLECVRTSILEAVDAISNQKGLRLLSETERQVTESRQFSKKR